MTKQIPSESLREVKALSAFGVQRRNVLKFLGASAAVVTLGTACDNDDDTPNVPQNNGTVFLGSGDFQILNFAYALEQLEAAFYLQVVATPAFGTIFTADEREFMTDIRDHEVIHREFFKAALGSNAIQALTPNFASINFSDRNSVLQQAKSFEDTGVSAYNGAGRYISNPDYLVAAGKIVSVEARHAAIIRDLIQNGTFADDLDANAKDIEKTPSAVVNIANMFLAEGSKLSTQGLPA